MNNNSISTIISKDKFPPLLSIIPNPPKNIYLLGSLPQGDYIAMVGTRRPSPYGKELCRQLVKSLSNTNTVIVSGLAQGIDSYCHQAALDYGIKTVAVLAQGLECKIHGERKILAENILKNGGGLISELPGNTPSFKGNFPARNRIIAALSKATVIIESKLKGGSMITVDFAFQYKRPIFAMCGNCLQETTQGCIDLLRKGIAKPIYLPEDFPDLCGLEIQKENSNDFMRIFPNLSEEAKSFFLKHSGYTKTLSELSQQSNMMMHALFSILTELELTGLVYSEDGFRYHFEKENFCKNLKSALSREL